jgi:hypothetical protein
MQRELVFSSLIFIISCIGTFFSYYSIIEHTEIDNILVKDIAEGSHVYSVLEANKCVGWVNYDLTQKNDISEIKSSGKLNFKYQDQAFAVDYALEASFNSIGQLGGALLRINIKDSYILVGGVNIDPIRVTVKSNLLAQEKEFVFSIPGPIELKKGDSEHFFISGLTLNKLQGTPLKLPLEAVDQEVINCTTGELEHFDITTYLDLARKLYGGYVQL